jgi:hypothetical protein
MIACRCALAGRDDISTTGVCIALSPLSMRKFDVPVIQITDEDHVLVMLAALEALDNGQKVRAMQLNVLAKRMQASLDKADAKKKR